MSRETENLQIQIHNSADSQEYRYIIQNVDLDSNNFKEWLPSVKELNNYGTGYLRNVFYVKYSERNTPFHSNIYKNKTRTNFLKSKTKRVRRHASHT